MRGRRHCASDLVELLQWHRRCTTGSADVESLVPSDSNSGLDLELELRRYCAGHPNAADTVEGVQRWWLADAACSREAVELALCELVERGVLAERSLPDGSVIYFCACGNLQPPG